ncbi:hypothetical protein THAOC_36946 [Thalassiosira oceanica]|uniref:Uncharacterized protein n=1 Tax=Thalassiosira oceanica TaxID=159749 RepID=K0R0Z1_THAOC|nr:hypothetical protein THAOC_36946 [Thalassiosira oceanica]|eukprot:EJK44504.1 hypothetical protein THAOC_36946 [Thalassiosira oceanica]
MMTSSSWLNLAGRTAVVFGGASGIGRATAIALAGQRCNVLLADIDSQALDEIKTWDDVIDVNLKGTFLACKKFCDPSRTSRLLQAGGGAIINIGSVVSSYGNVGQVNYSASKGGVEGLTRSLAKEMALLSRSNEPPTSSIRVSCILPGFIDTPMASAVPDKILDKMRAKTALGRLGQPQDVANLVLFLASNRSSFITGETLECSGMLRI